MTLLVRIFACLIAVMTVIVYGLVIMTHPADYLKIIKLGFFPSFGLLMWVVICITGPMTVVSLWRFQKRGRSLGICLCVMVILYYLSATVAYGIRPAAAYYLTGSLFWLVFLYLPQVKGQFR